MRLFGIAKETALSAAKSAVGVQANAAVVVFGFDKAVRAKLPIFWGFFSKGGPLLADIGQLSHFRFSKYLSMALRMISETVRPVRLDSALSRSMICSGR